ncbi:hypothetical protein D922_02988 [Enterococcus faecalis 06-MB-DW-09]|nr:hypothetical protein D922_02988 [Enterococcus faecalis 06-MB-DW-09]
MEIQAKKELKTLEIEQTDFLNFRMKSVKKRHPELKPASPHKLRPTSATLAKKYGMTMEDISNGLTHSNLETTGTYLSRSINSRRLCT